MKEQTFQKEYMCQWVEEEYSYFKIASRLAAIDYILETEEFESKFSHPYLNCSSDSMRNALKIKRRIKKTNDWKIVWPLVLQYRNGWSPEGLKEERRKLQAILKS